MLLTSPMDIEPSRLVGEARLERMAENPSKDRRDDESTQEVTNDTVDADRDISGNVRQSE